MHVPCNRSPAEPLQRRASEPAAFRGPSLTEMAMPPQLHGGLFDVEAHPVCAVRALKAEGLALSWPIWCGP
eukprot:5566760-Alexandrium_andersonii.AAC.1